MVRPVLIIAREMDWRIHHIAYVENLNPRRYLEPVHRFDQAEIAFLHEIEQRKVRMAISLGHRHDEAEVGLNQTSFQLVHVVEPLLQALPASAALGGAQYFRGNGLDKCRMERHAGDCAFDLPQQSLPSPHELRAWCPSGFL